MHVVQSGAARDRTNVKPEAVVGYLEGELATARGDPDVRGRSGVGVLIGVLQGLKAAEVSRPLDIGLDTALR